MTILEKQILKRGVDDWVALIEVDSLQQEEHPVLEESERRAVALHVILSLLEQDLVTVGVVTQDGFAAWPRDDVEHRLAEAYRQTDWDYAAWLANTESGDAEGERLEMEGP